MSKMSESFSQFTSKASMILGRAWVFVTALAFLAIWGISGPIFKFSDTWQLIINTSTTIITFLMVFIIQNTQNRDNMAINLKLDALLVAAKEISDEEYVDAEDLSDKLLEKRKKRMQEAEHKNHPSKKRSARKSK